MKIYIATPIHTRPEENFKSKFLAAMNRAKEMMELFKKNVKIKQGVEFVTTFDFNKSDEKESVAMGRCTQAVLDSDAILLDENWMESNGCRIEYQTAVLYEKDIYHIKNLQK